jgi:hypothetical protein
VCEMRADLSRPGDRTWQQIGPSCGDQESLVVNVGLKRRGKRLRQMRSVKTNESESPMKDRNQSRRCQNRGFYSGSGRSAGGGLFSASTASGLKVASARIGLMHGTLEPVVPMQREKSKRPKRKDQSTEAGHRGGMARSSVEASVMGVERRGRVIGLSSTGSTLSNRGRNL